MIIPVDVNLSIRVKVKFKQLHPDAKLPCNAHPGDAGLDLSCTSLVRTELYDEYGTGLAMELPQGYVGLLFPRSSISNKCQILANSVGVIDAGFRGEIKLRFKTTIDTEHKYKIGDKIGQLIVIPVPDVHTEWAFDLSNTDRNVGGFGSSGA